MSSEPSASSSGEQRPESSSEGTGRLLNIRFKTMEPANYDVSVPASTTVAALKSDHLAPKVNVPAERLRIIFKGRALADEQTLLDAHVEDNDTLHLVIRPADMPPQPQGAQQQARSADPSSNPNPNPNPLGVAGMLMPGVAVNLLQGLMNAVGGQPGTIQINTTGPIPFGATMTGGVFSQQQPQARAQPGQPEPQPVPSASATPSPGPAPAQQQQVPGSPEDASGSPSWLQAPHLVSAINSFLEILQSPNYTPLPMPLAWHPLPPAVNQGLALSRLTDGLREVLQGVYLPAELRSLLEASQADREGREGATPAAAGAAAAAAPASAPGPANPASNPAAALPWARQAGVQNVPDLSNYRYLPLAVAALAELTRRADTHMSSSLTRRMRELCGAIMALAGDHRNRVLEQHVQILGQHLSSSAALLTELARLATGLSSALQGNVAPLVFSRPTMLQPNGSSSIMPILQPQMGMQQGMPPGFPGMMPGGFPGMPPGFPGMMPGMPGTAPGGAPLRPGMVNLTPAMLQQMLMQGRGMPGGGAAGMPAGGTTAQVGRTPNASQQQQEGAAGEAGRAADGGGQAPGGGAEGPPGMNLQGAIRIDIVDDGSGGDISATLGPLLNGMLGPMMGGLAMPDMSAVLQQHQQQMNQQRMMQQHAAAAAAAAQQGHAPTPAPADGSAGARQAPPGGPEHQQGQRGQLSSYLTVLRPLIQMIATSAANTVSQRLVPLQPLLQSPAQTGQLVGTLVSEVLNESMSNVIETWAAHEDQINAALQQMESTEVDGPSGLQELVQLAQVLVGNIMGGPMGGQGQAQGQAQRPPPAAAEAGAAAGTAAAPSPSVPPASPGEAGLAAEGRATAPAAGGEQCSEVEAGAATTAAAGEKPRTAASAAGEAAAARQLRAAGAEAGAVPPAGAEQNAPSSSLEAGAAEQGGLPASRDAAAPAAAAVASSSSSQPAAPTQAGPRGLGMGLKPMAKKKPAAPPASKPAEPAAAGGTGAAGSRAGADAGSVGAGAGAGGGGGGGSAAAAAPDMSNLMTMVGRMMSGAGGGAGQLGGMAAAPGAGAGAAGAGGPGGGLGGLLQMATSLANDPAMQPMLQSAMSSLMGGAGGGGAAGGGAGGLGGLLGNLMGSLGGPGGASSRSGAPPQVEEVLDLGSLEQELEPEEAARWRSIIEHDEQVQQQQQQQEAGAGGSQPKRPRFSSVYEAGLPQQSQTLLDTLTRQPEQS